MSSPDRRLADVVRENCGREALKLALAEDEKFEKRLGMGQLMEKIAPDADYFFQRLIGRGTPLRGGLRRCAGSARGRLSRSPLRSGGPGTTAPGRRVPPGASPRVSRCS